MSVSEADACSRHGDQKSHAAMKRISPEVPQGGILVQSRSETEGCELAKTLPLRTPSPLDKYTPQVRGWVGGATLRLVYQLTAHSDFLSSASDPIVPLPEFFFQRIFVSYIRTLTSDVCYKECEKFLHTC